MKATEQQLQEIYEEAVSAEIADRNGVEMAYFDLLCKLDEVGGMATFIRTMIEQVRAANTDREMLKRLAVILSGSDAPGEIRSLTVTAQSFVDRCKTLAKERDALQLAGGQPQRDMPLSARANGEANSYTLLRGGNWFANILMNGEMTVPQQWDFLNTIAKKQ